MKKTRMLLPFVVSSMKLGGNDARRILVRRLYRESRHFVQDTARGSVSRSFLVLCFFLFLRCNFLS
uniref:Uncharacterized protein n=1 Tax=Setaria viridis TaxID=4556 RepID=A0A4U6T989_SETVI|nr:hypothetical protein SEVIR_9G488066v2 [Setaria viridis]